MWYACSAGAVGAVGAVVGAPVNYVGALGAVLMDSSSDHSNFGAPTAPTLFTGAPTTAPTAPVEATAPGLGAAPFVLEVELVNDCSMNDIPNDS